MTTPDIATLGLAIDSSQAEKGALTLDKLAASARKFEDQATKMALGTTTAFKSVGGGVDAAAKKLEDNAAKMSGAFAKVGKDAALGAGAVGSAADKMAADVEDSAAAATGALMRLDRQVGAGAAAHVADSAGMPHPVASSGALGDAAAGGSHAASQSGAATIAFDRLSAAAMRAEAAAIAVGAGYAAAGHDVMAATGTFDAAAAQITRQAAAESAAVDDVTRSMDRQRAAAERLVSAAAPAVGASSVAAADASVTQIMGARVSTADPLERVTKGVNDNVKAVGLARHEWTNLSRQLQDVLTMGFMGASLPQIATSQAAQVYDALASSSVGAKAALAEVGSTALRVATHPLTILAAVVGMAGVAVMRFRDQQAELERALNGVGRAAGASAGQLSAIADATARSGAMSRGQAVSGAAQIAQAGIGVENIPTLLGDAPRFSRAFGLELADAYAEITKIVGDQGLGAFERRFGPVSAATKESVTALEQMGRFSEAAALKTRMLDEEVKRAKDSTGLLSRGWEAFTSLPGKALDGLGAGLDALLPKFRTVELPRQAQAASPAPGAGSLSDYERRIGLSQEITPAQRERDRIDLNRRSELAGPLIDQLSPDDVQRRTMERQLAVLKPLTETADGLAALGERAGAAKEAVAQISTALANFQTPAERMRQDNELAVQSIGAYSFEQRAAVAAEQARVATLRQTNDKMLAAIASEGARNAALAESSRRLDDMAREAQDRAQLRGLSPLQAGLAEVDIRYGRLAEQSAPQDAGRVDALRQQERLNVLAQSATQTMDQIRPDLAQRRQLEDARDAIRAMLSDKDGLAALGDRADEAREAFDKLGVAIGLLRSPLERVTEANALAIRSAEAETAGQRAQIAAEQAFRAELQSSHDRLAAVTAAEGARNVVLLESARAMRDEAKDARHRADIAGLNPYQRMLRETEYQYQRDLKRADASPGSGADMSVFDRSVVVPFDRAGGAASRLADALMTSADRIGRIVSLPEQKAATQSPTPFFAQSGGDFYRSIMRAEGTDKFGDPYNTSLGYMRSPKPLVEMTMAESLAWGDQVRRAQGLNSSAKGAFQITNTTQRDAMRALGLGANDLFSAENQNRMADWIFKTQGIGAWEGFKRPGAALPAAARASVANGGVVENSGEIEKNTSALEKRNAARREWERSNVDQWINGETTALEEQRRAIELSTGSWGTNRAAIAAAEEKQRLLNEAQRLGINVSKAYGDSTKTVSERLDELAQKAADNATAQDQMRRRVAGYDLARSSVGDIAGDSALALARGEDVGAAAKGALARAGENLMRQSIGNIIENFMGAMGSDSLGPLGSLLGIGGGSEKNAANVNIKAANVNLSGAGLAGGGGLLDKIAGGGNSGGGFLGGLFSGIGDFIGGLFKFENGGIMTSAGALPLHRYATGGIADRPQLALFGEGRGPEAFVPLPDGRRIPVHMTMPPAVPPQVINMQQPAAAPKISFNNYAPNVEAIPRVMSDGEIIVEIRKTAATMIAANNKKQAEAGKRAS